MECFNFRRLIATKNAKNKLDPLVGFLDENESDYVQFFTMRLLANLFYRINYIQYTRKNSLL